MPFLFRAARWMAELVLVFVSVYAAFWLSNYQQHQQDAERRDRILASIEQTLRKGIESGKINRANEERETAEFQRALDAGEMPPLRPFVFMTDYNPGDFGTMLQSGGIQLLDLQTLTALRNDESVIRWGLSRLARYQKLSDELIVPNLDQDISFFYDPATKKLRKRFEIYPEALQATVKFANDLETTHTRCSNEFKPNANSIVNMIPRIRSLAFVLAIFTASFVFAADYPRPPKAIMSFAISNSLRAKRYRSCVSITGRSENRRKMRKARRPMQFSSPMEQRAAARNLSGRSSPANSLARDQPLDATKFFIVLPDGIGHGKSSKPSDGMHAKFPRYGYIDMVEAQFRLLTEGLGVNHARLVMGTSMGGMHTWLWGETHPDFMDALMPLASLPTQISGRNRAWRRMIIDAIRNDPEWPGGEYKAQPPSLRTAAEMLWLMSSNPVLRQKEAQRWPKPTKSLTNLSRIT